MCKGFGDGLKGASDRWHITSTDLNPESFPLLSGIATRKFCHGVAFHGFSKRPEDADLYIGGGASDTLKRAIRKELVAANLPLQIRIATENDDPKFQGRSDHNLINRLAAQGIHIEQSGEAREFSEKIAKAIATVYRSPIRRFLCALTNLFR
jgi:Poly-gamma-glutamate hydrolase